ncbi:unnamed protein product [Alternaria alternata]
MAQQTKPKPWDSVFEHEAKKVLLRIIDAVMNLWSQEKGKVLEWTSYSHQLVGTKQALQVEQDTSHALRQQLDAEQKTSQALKQQLDAEQKTSLRLRQQVLYTQMHEFLPGTTASQYAMYPLENLIAHNPIS